MFLDTLDLLLRYPLSMMLKHRDYITHDLYQLNLINLNELEIISTTDNMFHHKMIATMVSETIINGDKSDFSKFTTYLQSYSDIKYLVQYWRKMCKLTFIDTIIIRRER